MFRALIYGQSGLRYLRRKSVVVPLELEQQLGGAALFDHIGPELDVAPLLDSGTDLEDELPSPNGSPMVISPVVRLLPAQVEEDVDLAQILAEFGTLPAIVTPINDPQEEREMPPVEYRPPEVPADVFVTPAGPVDGDGRPPTGSVDCPPSALAAPVVPTSERNLLFPRQTWIGPPSGGETVDYRLPTVPLPSRATAVSQPVDELNTLRERVSVPDLSREGPFDIHQDRLHLDASLRSCQDSQGCPFRITSYNLEIDGSDFSPEYGVQLHDPRLLEYVGAPESARLLSRSPEYFVQHMGKEETLSAALQLQHDAGLILSNVQVLQQLVTAFHNTSTNMMGAVRGHQPFPTHAMRHTLPSCRVRRAAHYMTAMGMWHPPITPGI